MYYSFKSLETTELVDLNEIDRLCCEISGYEYSERKYSPLYRALIFAIMENAFNGEMNADNTYSVTLAWDVSPEESRHLREATFAVYDRYVVDVWR